MMVERAKAMAIGSSEIATASAGQGFSPCMPSVVIHAARAEVLCSPLLSTQHKATSRATADDAARRGSNHE